MFDTQLAGPRAGDIRGIPDIHDSLDLETFIFELKLNTVQVNITQIDSKTDLKSRHIRQKHL